MSTNSHAILVPANAVNAHNVLGLPGHARAQRRGMHADVQGLLEHSLPITTSAISAAFDAGQIACQG